MGEFEFIEAYLSELAGEQGLALQDDVALWTPPRGRDAVISMDTIVEGVHFPDGKFDGQIAQKLIAVNVSDVVAKGAKPLGYFLSLSIPKRISQDQLKLFCAGLKTAQNEYGLKLWGGDTTRSKAGIVLSATIIASLPQGEAVLRTGAKIGDLVCVSGTVGDGYLGLKASLNQIDRNVYSCKNWLNHYHQPTPPFAQLSFIRRVATSALDVSDGLIADAQHLAAASDIGLEIDLEALPLSGETKKWLAHQTDKQAGLLKLASGGDDYQVLMTIPPHTTKDMAVQKAGFTIIGRVVEGKGVSCFSGQMRLDIADTGYQHF